MRLSSDLMRAEQLNSSVRAMHPQLYGMLKRLVGSPADAEDVLHDTYERLLSTPELHTWETERLLLMVKQIATRGAIDLLKRQRATAKLKQNLAEQPESSLGITGMPDEQLNAQQMYRSLVSSFGMSNRTRQIFVLFNVYEYSPREIALRLGISEQTVRSNLRNGRALLSSEARNSDTRGTPPPRREIYHVSQQIALPPSQIIVDVAPKIVVASAALAERLKREPQSVYNLAPRQFEVLVAELLEDLGYRVEITPATRDGGKDLLAYLDTELGTLLCLVEAKRYRHDHKIGVELVRSLYGTVSDAQANQGMLITTSTFTQDAREFQRRHRYLLALKDYDDLKRWIRRYGERTS